MRRRLMVPLLIGVFCAAAAACGGNDQKARYGNDGLMGLSNSNPSLPTNPTYHTYNDDTRMIYRALQTVHGVNSAKVVLNGPDAYITIRVAEPATMAEKQRVRSEAQKAVSAMMPRYHVTVTVQ